MQTRFTQLAQTGVRRMWVTLLVFTVAFTATFALPHPAQAANKITFHCATDSIMVKNGGTTIFQLNRSQLTTPLHTAILSGHHQLIASADGASLWALTSNELQAHWDYDPDGTKVIVSADYCTLTNSLPQLRFQCRRDNLSITARFGGLVMNVPYNELAGPLYTAILSGQNQYIATNNGASLWALRSNEFQVHWDRAPDSTKEIMDATTCGVIPVQIVSGNPIVPSTSNVSVSSPTTYSTTYVVQPGDNLFRISLKFGRTMAQIAQANGITNYNLIYVGQTLSIP